MNQRFHLHLLLQERRRVFSNTREFARKEGGERGEVVTGGDQT